MCVHSSPRCAARHLTCGGDAVEADEGIEAGGGTREDPGEPKGHEAPLTQALLQRQQVRHAERQEETEAGFNENCWWKTDCVVILSPVIIIIIIICPTAMNTDMIWKHCDIIIMTGEQRWTQGEKGRGGID